MRAAIMTERNGTPTVVSIDEPLRVPNTLKIRVEAAGLQPTDIMRARGEYKTPALPYIIGGEGVGELEDGSRVYFGHSIAASGAFAEWTIVPEEEVWPLPAGVDAGQAIALAIAGTGALIPLQEAGIRPGDRVLVLGATGPLGQVALQAAKALGAGCVVAAARTIDRLELLKARGIADEIVQLGAGNDEIALKGVAGSGFDVVLDGVYGPPFRAALRNSAFGARLMTVGASAGMEVSISAWDMVRRSHNGVGTGYRPAAERRKAWQWLLDLAADGRMDVDVAWFDLEGVASAWAAQLGSPGAKIVARIAT